MDNKEERLEKIANRVMTKTIVKILLALAAISVAPFAVVLIACCLSLVPPLFWWLILFCGICAVISRLIKKN